MNFDEIMAKQAQIVAKENGVEVPSSGSESDNDTSLVTPDQQTVDSPPVADTQEVTEDTSSVDAVESDGLPETPAVPEVDYSKFLEESSGGLFKSVEDFTASLTKVKEYDELKQKVQELESRDPFANDYVKKLNAMVAAGKTQDQIDAFTALSKLGDIASLDPFEVKVQRLVFDGYPRATAERRIKEQFGLNINLNEDDLTTEELAENKIKLEDAEIALKISSREDAAYLQSQLASIEGNEDKQARLLKEAAAKEAYEKKLTPFVNQLASNYEKGVSVPVKVGDHNIEYKFDFDEDFRMDVAKMAKEFFLENDVTEENIRSFKDFTSAQYIAKRLTSDILPNAIKHGFSLGKKAAADEYENKSGLTPPSERKDTQSQESLLREAMRRAAHGED